MKNNAIALQVSSWIFAAVLLTLGLLNLALVHPVPGIAYLLLSCLYLPPVSSFLTKKTGFPVPPAVKIILGIVIIWFTLGISDLAEIAGL